MYIKLGCQRQRLFCYAVNSRTYNPLAPFIKGEFFKSPLEKGDSGGCLIYHVTNFEFPIHRVRKSPPKRGIVESPPKTCPRFQSGRRIICAITKYLVLVKRGVNLS